MSQQIAASKRRAALLLGGVVVVVAVVVLAVGLVAGQPWFGLVLGLLLGVVAAVAAALAAEPLALRAAGARPVGAADQPRLANLVEGLCVASGLPVPRLYVVESASLNAMATGRGSRRGAIVVTTGLLGALDRVELEGVVAHELTHLRDRSAVPATLAVPVLGFLLPVTAGAVRAVCGSWREHEADAAAVQLTRYPPGLAAALGKMAADPQPLPTASKRIAHLWVHGPGTDLAERIAVLREL